MQSKFFEKKGLPMAVASSSPIRVIQTVLSHLKSGQFLLPNLLCRAGNLRKTSSSYLPDCC